MDHERFDALTRAFSRTPSSRRRLLRRGGMGLVAALFGGAIAAKDAAADHCSYIGCGCATGTYHPCADGLICCPSAPGTPGGAGVCAPAGECGDQCIYWGDQCPDYCNWGDTCPGCCSGYCGQFGQCYQAGYGF